MGGVIDFPVPTPDMAGDLVDCLNAVSGSAFQAKDWIPAKRAALLALEVDPRNTDARMILGRIALSQRDYEAAAMHFSRAEKTPAMLVNLAIADANLRRFALALDCCSRAIEMQPDFVPAHIQRAAIFEETGDVSSAEAAVRFGLHHCPAHPELLFMLALHQLRRGDFENGWNNYEQRQPRIDLARKLDEYPEWQGEDLGPIDDGVRGCPGKTLLVCGEQGIGDQIMWARYLPLLVELGARVVLFTKPELARLFASVFPPIRIITSDREFEGLEPDYWVAMGSLPLCWRQYEAIDVVETPQEGALSLPYLWPAREDCARFRSIVGNNPRLKVGLCFKGNPQHRRDAYRSVPFAEIQPLLEIQGVDFFSLQFGDRESGLVNLTEYVHDLADTAAAIAALDLVITVDTAILHLAGAMGKPVWGLMYTPGDWRWREGAETPWYHRARLFRQEEPGNWRNVVAAVSAALDSQAGIEGSDGKRYFLRPDPYFFPPTPPPQTLAKGDCKYGRMTWLRNDHYIGRALDLYGEYSESEADLLRKVLQPGQVVVEAGANVGGLTLPLAEIVGPRGTVYAFEPQLAYFLRLLDNAKMLTQVHPLNTALGRDLRWIELRGVEETKVHAPGWEAAGPMFKVQQYRIDGLRLPECALIKIDVDGAEDEILRGAEATIDRCRPLIYVEHDKPEAYPEMLPWLHAKGYRLYRHAAPLFNRSNFRGFGANVFGSIVSLMVLAVPVERKGLHPCDWGLERIALG